MRDQSGRRPRRGQSAPSGPLGGGPPPLELIAAPAVDRAAVDRAAAPSRSRGHWLRSLAGWLGAVLFSLVVTELFLRAVGLPQAECEFVSLEFGPDTFVFDAERLWRLHPDCPDYRVNAQGLRGWWPTEPKARDEFRIVCVGDSCTFGTGVRSDETYGMQLAHHVQGALPGQRVRAALFALPGYSTFQSAVLLRQHLDQVQPDLVVFYCGTWNDYLPAWQHTDAEWARRYAEAEGSLRLTSLLRRLTGSAGDGPRPADLMAAFGQGAEPERRRVPLADFTDNLRSMVDRVRSHGSEAIVVLPALPGRTVAQFPIALQYREASRRVAQVAGAIVFDAGAAVAEFEAQLPSAFHGGNTAREVAFSDWAHPSVIGHGVIARALMGCWSSHTERVSTPAEPTPLASDAPVVACELEGPHATLSWPAIAGAVGYALYWTRVGEADASGCFDVASNRFALELWPGATFRVCVQAYGRFGVGPISQCSVVAVDTGR